MSPSRLQGLYGLLVSVGCFPFSFLNPVGKQAREFESLSQVRRHAQEPVLPVSPSAQKEKGFEERGRGVFSHPRFPNC